MSNSRTPVRAIIQNYANHHNSTVEFKPGVNWIIGTNDSGKSQLLRAILTVLLNENIPSDARSIGADGKPHPGAMKLRVEFNDGSFIERVSSSKVNTIEIGEPGVASTPLARVADATEEVRLLTGVINHPTMPRLFPQVQRLGDPLLLADSSQGKSIYQILSGLLFPTKIPQLRKAVASDLRAAQTENKFLAQRRSVITDNPIYSDSALDDCESRLLDLKRRDEEVRRLAHIVNQCSQSAHDLMSIPALDPKTVESAREGRQKLEGLIASHKTYTESKNHVQGIIKAAYSIRYLPAAQPADTKGRCGEIKLRANWIQNCVREVALLRKTLIDMADTESQLRSIERPEFEVCKSCEKLCLSGGSCGV